MFKTPSTVRSTRAKAKKLSVKKKENNLLLKNDFCEIKVLQKSSHEDAIDAMLDIDSGFVVLSTEDHCLAWNPRNSLISPTRLELPDIVVSCFSKSSSAGLIACSKSGLIRVWNNAELQSSRDFQLEVPPDAQPCFIKQYSDGSFIVGIDSGMLFKIFVDDQNIYSEIFTKNGPSLWGFFASSGSSNSLLPKGENYVDACVGTIDMARNCSFYATSTNYVQKWKIGSDGKHFFCWETNIIQLLAIFEKDNFIEKRIVAIDSCKGDTIACLIRFNFANKTFKYKLLTLDEKNDILSIGEIFSLQTEDSVVSGMKHPKLAISNGGPVAFIAFSDRLVTTLISPGYDMEKTIPFKNQDLIGIAVDTQFITQASWEKDVSALMYSLSAGVLQISIPLDQYLELNGKQVKMPEMSEVRKRTAVKKARVEEEDFDEFMEDSPDSSIASKLEQVVFFNQPENPITLEIGPIAGDLNQPALALSNSLLNGTNDNLSNIMGESKYLHDIVVKCREIMNCISNGGLVYKLTETTRFHLLHEAERMAVMRDLWDYQNEIYTNSTDEDSQGFLESAIIDFLAMKKLDITVKDFFKKMAFALPEFFMHLQVHFQSILQRKPDQYIALSYVFSKILVIAYNAAFGYRSENEKLYKIDQRRLTIEPWNSSPDLIQVLQKQLETCIDALRKVTSQTSETEASYVGFVVDPTKFLIEFKALFCDLAKFTLCSFHCLKSYYTLIEDHRHADSLWERYQVVQTKAIDSMLLFSLSEDAFALAEAFKDYSTLVQLLLNTPNKNQRIKAYISKFGYDFAVVLYQTLLDKSNYRLMKGMLKELMEQDLVRSDYLKEFLVSHNLLHLLWVQQFAHDEYYDGSKTLWELAGKDRRTKTQGLCLAIAKLAYLETVSYEDLQAGTIDESITKFEAAEDLIQMHSLVSDHLKGTLSDNFFDDMANQKVNREVMKRCFSGIPKSHTIMTKIVEICLGDILSGYKLTPAGMIDLITAMDPVADFFADALKLSVELQDPAMSKFYLHLIWRRCWLSSDWKKIDQTPSDDIMKAELDKTAVFQLATSKEIEGQGQYLVAPKDIALTIPENLADNYPFLDSKEVQGLVEELRREHKEFVALCQAVDLSKYYSECVVDVGAEMEVD